MILPGAAGFGLAAVVLGAKAATNVQGLVIDGIIELGVTGATVFFWILCALSVGFVIAAILLFYQRIRFPQRIVFGESSLEVPVKRGTHDRVEIAYRSIGEMSVAQMHGQKWLEVTHAGGTFTIMASLLKSDAVFEEVCGLLAQRVNAAKVDGPPDGR